MSDTAPRYPAGIDTNLKIPRTPSVARLSEAEAPQDYGFVGENQNSHSDLHHAENNSIQQMERSLTPDFNSTSHDHSDAWNVDYSLPEWKEYPSKKHGRKLRVRNTHVFSDNSNPTNAQESRPDVDFVGIHHSLGGDDDLGDYQAVSGALWKKKNLPDVPDSMFDQLNQLINQWLKDYLPYPGDNLKNILVALLQKIKDNEDKLNNRIDELEKEIEKNQGVMEDIIKHIWGVQINPDGTIKWPDDRMKIPMGDLNIFSDANPDNNTKRNAIRTRDLSNADIKTQ